MVEVIGLRDRKKQQTRQRIADVAATLFAAHGYDAVSMAEVARAAEVSDQTVYNYFASKWELVLDRADEIRGWYDQAIRLRGATVSPADALEPLVRADIERYRSADLEVARGEFMAQTVASPTLRRFVLEERERQTRTVAAAIEATAPELPTVIALTHAAALIAAIQHIHDRIGADVLSRTEQAVAAEELQTTAGIALADLADVYAATIARSPGGTA